jgi:hypothetical protein
MSRLAQRVWMLVLSAAAAWWPLFAHADDDPPPPVDLSGWVFVDIPSMYGEQWPEGYNPDYAAWRVPKDGRPYQVKAITLTVNREYTYGDPPITTSYWSFTDVAMGIWIGDDRQIHSFTTYKYQNVYGRTVDETFVGMLTVPPGTSAEALFSALAPQTVPTNLATWHAVPTIPEPASLSLALAGAVVCACARRRAPSA